MACCGHTAALLNAMASTHAHNTMYYVPYLASVDGSPAKKKIKRNKQKKTGGSD